MTPTSSKHGAAWMESDEAVGVVRLRIAVNRVSGGVPAAFTEVLLFKSGLRGTVLPDVLCRDFAQSSETDPGV